MKRNIGKLDKNIRILLAIIVAALYFTHIINGLTAIILGIVAIVLLATAFINFCPIWAALGINTLKKNPKT